MNSQIVEEDEWTSEVETTLHTASRNSQLGSIGTVAGEWSAHTNSWSFEKHSNTNRARLTRDMWDGAQDLVYNLDYKPSSRVVKI